MTFAVYKADATYKLESLNNDKTCQEPTMTFVTGSSITSITMGCTSSREISYDANDAQGYEGKQPYNNSSRKQHSSSRNNRQRNKRRRRNIGIAAATAGAAAA